MFLTIALSIHNGWRVPRHSEVDTAGGFPTVSLGERTVRGILTIIIPLSPMCSREGRMLVH